MPAHDKINNRNAIKITGKGKEGRKEASEQAVWKGGME